MNLRGNMRDEYRKLHAQLVSTCEELEERMQELPGLVESIQQLLKRINGLEPRSRGLRGVSGVKLASQDLVIQAVRNRLGVVMPGADDSPFGPQVDPYLRLDDVARADAKVIEEGFIHYEQRGL